MAASRRSRPPDDAAPHAVERAVAALVREIVPAGAGVAVALSGGRDSIALLDALSRLAPHVRPYAFHVHHGLSASADAWASFCRGACAARGVAFAMREVTVDARRDGMEAAARAARYDALRSLAREHGVHDVLLAHHADDQAETLLLQLLRGAGPHGLAAMPRVALDRGVRWIRPLLSVSRAAIDDYVDTRHLAYVDDESNAHAQHRRNALRAHVVPALCAIAPGYPATLARAAEHQASAAALLDELAALDAAPAFDGRSLDVHVLAVLSAARAANVVRWFLRQRSLRPPSTARLAAMLRQLRAPRRDARVDFAHDGARVSLYRGRLFVHRPPAQAFLERWNGASEVRLPHGTLVFTRTRGGGIAGRWLDHANVTIRSGTRGERLALAGRATPRPVADLLREAGVPRWERLALPRIYRDEALVALPEAGVGAAFAAAPGEAGVSFAWYPG